MTDNVLSIAQHFTDRDLIESVVNSYFILDYGVVSKVNADKTVNVTHAKIQELQDGTQLPALETKNLEVLTFCTAGFSINPEIKAGDKVLLLGLKDYVPKAEDVSGATAQTAYLHYKRNTMKALPLCLFNADAKIKVEAEAGVMKVTADKVELNGNGKQFVTWSELNSALQSLWTSIQGHTHQVATSGGPTSQTGTASASLDLATVTLDLSDSKTTTILTGG